MAGGIDPAFFTSGICDLARALLGSTLLMNGVGGIVVETEAYDTDDPGSHSFNGPTRRNASMFGPRGRAYVYRIYGAHWCLNVVGGSTPGAAVLIRALEPTHGLDAMRLRRGVEDVRKLCSGPGKLCQALAISGDLDGLPIDRPPFHLQLATRPTPVVVGARIGLTKGAETARRFGMQGSPFVSRPFRA